MNLIKLTVLTACFCLILGCSSDSNNEPDIQIEELTHVAHEVLQFEFIPDTGNNTRLLRYQIKFSNPNNVAVNGYYRVTLNTDGLIATTFTNVNGQCGNIAANSDCITTFEAEDSLELANVNSITLVGVEYVIVSE
ncbi:hypothetical protein [Flavobacterium orientale]|uniref:Lipoprotein n=1 Tax=Flavobacterium orientale TaxID=1756020 RepID=A0A916Y5D8_9FLAO|nr:hypothetical protein [Flavobacterium orientale]GGD31525.1 hypothetical protein GCM10011343_22130 [Flavobacterium orientale]